MHVVIRVHLSDRCTASDLGVTAPDGTATVDDLAAAAWARVATVSSGAAATGPLRLSVSGREVNPGTALRRVGMTEGDVIDIWDGSTPWPPAAPSGRAAAPVVVLKVEGGLACGRETRLGAGTHDLGRATLAPSDTTVSAHHVIATAAPDGTIRVADAGSTNGTWLDTTPLVAERSLELPCRLRLGASRLTVEAAAAAAADRPASLAGPHLQRGRRVPFNRPPRPEVPPPPPPLDPPVPPSADAPGLPVGIVAVVAPIVIGLVMIKALGSVLYGLFALLGPVMLVGGAIEGRRRRRKGSRREATRYARELADFRALLARRADGHRAALDDLAPGPAEALRRAIAPSTRLWERRPGHADHLRVRAGTGPVHWEPPVDGDPRSRPAEVTAIIDTTAVLTEAPVVIDLRNGAVVGVVGPRRAALAVARSLVVQAATHHGPADLPLAIACAESVADDWDWAKWLPHLEDRSRGTSRLAPGASAVDVLVGQMNGPARAGPDGPTLLFVVDGDELLHSRRAPARAMLRGSSGPVAGLVVTSTPDHLPASCTTVIELVDRHGHGRVHHLSRGQITREVLVDGIEEAVARRGARALAGFDDPEATGDGTAIPPRVDLATLLSMATIDADAIVERWASADADPRGLVPIGMSDDGPLHLDLDRDGPHALVAGTTGAGKSELLRALVTGLAAALPPEHLTFVLIDFKGGSAFDRCAELPHVVGMVTDLDAHLAGRALRCLDAETRRRERVLRAAGAEDLAAYRRSGAPDPIPRLVVVIDELATLKAELPDFVDSLVGVAQRGRSLGMHLVLATQRPSGAISDNVRANTNLRIALRVQDPAESTDVVGVATAAEIGRDQPGRAVARLGPSEVVAFQAALATGRAPSDHEARLRLAPFGVGAIRSAEVDRGADPPGSIPGPTTLDVIVGAAIDAHRRRGGPAPWRPWPDPLPAQVTLDQVPPADGLVAFAVGDDPEAQRWTTEGWAAGLGGLLLVGLPGSGTTTACASLVLAAAAMHPPDDLVVHVLDMGGSDDLGALAGLAHVASVIGPGERERQARLVRLLRADLDRRQAGAGRPPGPLTVLVLDGIAAFRSAWEDALLGLLEDLERVVADGPEVRIATVLTADRLGAVPPGVAAVMAQRWLFRAGDPLDHQAAGLGPAEVGDLPPGGAVIAASRRRIQVARPSGGVPHAVARLAAMAPRPTRPHPEVRALPSTVTVESVAERARIGGGGDWVVPVGVGGDDIGPVTVTLRAGEHLLVAGPARSGRSALLVGLAATMSTADPALTVLAVAGPRSPLGLAPGLIAVADPRVPGAVAELTARAASGRGSTLVLVDDAEGVTDDDGALAALVASGSAHVHVVAAGRNDALRSAYGHWTGGIRSSHLAVLLCPDVDLDGDLAGTVLPRRWAVAPAIGRGYLVDGATATVVQALGGPASP